MMKLASGTSAVQADAVKVPPLLPWIPLLCWVAGGTLSGSEAARDELTPPVEKQFLPFDVLPPGTVMERVRLPRYRGDELLGEVLADRLTIESERLVQGQSVRVSWSTGAASLGKTVASLPSASYDFRQGMLRARNGVQIQDPRFLVRAPEMDLDLSRKKAWLMGPLLTIFQRSPDAFKNKPLEGKKMKNALLKMTPIMAGVALCKAETPARPTAGDWREVQELSSIEPIDKMAPSEADWEELRVSMELDQSGRESAAQLHEQIDASASENRAEQELMRGFLEELDRALPVAVADDEKEVKSGDKQVVFEEALKMPEFVIEGPQIVVKCEGGMFFDVEKGLFIYTDQIQVRDPDFKLDCSGQLKIYLEKKTPSGRPGEVGAKKAEGQSGLKSFGSIDRLAATGDVVVVTKDDKGKPITASAESLVYHAKRGDILLTGGVPTVVTSELKVEVKGEKAFIKIGRDGGVLIDGKSKQTFKRPKNGGL